MQLKLNLYNHPEIVAAMCLINIIGTCIHTTKYKIYKVKHLSNE